MANHHAAGVRKWESSLLSRKNKNKITYSIILIPLSKTHVILRLRLVCPPFSDPGRLHVFHELFSTSFAFITLHQIRQVTRLNSSPLGTISAPPLSVNRDWSCPDGNCLSYQVIN
jgi:hypothetical protein